MGLAAVPAGLGLERERWERDGVGGEVDQCRVSDVVCEVVQGALASSCILGVEAQESKHGQTTVLQLL